MTRRRDVAEIGHLPDDLGHCHLAIRSRLTPQGGGEVSVMTYRGNDGDVEPPVSYRVGVATLAELPRHVIAQASPEEAALAERLLGQLASLHVHSESHAGGLPLTFRPAPATADLAARALAALHAAERPAGVPEDRPVSEIWH